MDENYRRIIRSTISSHFMETDRERNSEGRVYRPDFISGKGRGLIVLLHGAPGVGKTATAEAVALEYQKPLFPITCGDLGITPEGRDRTDIERNAMVSVFLRILEYYSGILFLTTNRPVLSHLSRFDTLAILKSNLASLSDCYKPPNGEPAKAGHILIDQDESEEYIRNAVQIAKCLASFESPNGPAKLKAHHFNTVNLTMTEFDRYLEDARGVSDQKFARREGVRSDLRVMIVLAKLLVIGVGGFLIGLPRCDSHRQPSIPDLKVRHQSISMQQDKDLQASHIPVQDTLQWWHRQAIVIFNEPNKPLTNQLTTQPIPWIAEMALSYTHPIPTLLPSTSLHEWSTQQAWKTPRLGSIWHRKKDITATVHNQSLGLLHSLAIVHSSGNKAKLDPLGHRTCR
ncbi:hypothetical protein MW887_011393 [Aspergillus wentii]|nr:hypothetical protein MW887_011393 [Aspergillus wentii]